MSGPNFILDKGFIVEGTGTISQYTCVELGTGDQSVKPMTGAGKMAIGVIQERIDTTLATMVPGKVAANIRLGGITAVVASAAIAKGDSVAAAADGRAVKATTGQFILGVALTSASAAGNIVNVLMTSPGMKAA